jgi:PAS domain S-box-containing protein
LAAIRRGEVDALVVESPAGPRVFTLEGVDAESNRFRGEILAQVSDAVIATDPEQRIIYLNPAAERQYGVAAVDVLGRRREELYEARWLCAEDEAEMTAALASRGEWRGESTHILRNGRVLRVESHFTVFRDGAIRGLLAVIRDVTERRRQDEAVLEVLRQADRRKDEFLAILAHELRNPLAPVVNALQYLRMKGPSTTETEWARDVISRQVQYLTRLIDDLMDVSRINRGRILLKRERVELASAVQEAVEASLPIIEDMGHDFSIEMQAGAVILHADTTRLAQVLLNLLNNAAKYTERGGKIELRVEPDGDGVAISVRDTGIGIPADKLATIFEMFSQVDGALSRSQNGLGIGLYLVKRLVEMHDGTIRVRSDGPGKGSEFLVRLPVVEIEPLRAQLNEGDGVAFH